MQNVHMPWWRGRARKKRWHKAVRDLYRNDRYGRHRNVHTQKRAHKGYCILVKPMLRTLADNLFDRRIFLSHELVIIPVNAKT